MKEHKKFADTDIKLFSNESKEALLIFNTLEKGESAIAENVVQTSLSVNLTRLILKNNVERKFKIRSTGTPGDYTVYRVM